MKDTTDRLIEFQKYLKEGIKDCKKDIEAYRITREAELERISRNCQYVTEEMLAKFNDMFGRKMASKPGGIDKEKA